MCSISSRSRETKMFDLLSACHSFRATGVTQYMNSGGTIEMAQRIARTYELVDKIAAVNVKDVDLIVLLRPGVVIIMEFLD
jgi:hypothetical protein